MKVRTHCDILLTRALRGGKGGERMGGDVATHEGKVGDVLLSLVGFKGVLLLYLFIYHYFLLNK